MARDAGASRGGPAERSERPRRSATRSSTSSPATLGQRSQRADAAADDRSRRTRCRDTADAQRAHYGSARDSAQRERADEDAEDDVGADGTPSKRRRASALSGAARSRGRGDGVAASAGGNESDEEAVDRLGERACRVGRRRATAEQRNARAARDASAADARFVADPRRPQGRARRDDDSVSAAENGCHGASSEARAAANDLCIGTHASTDAPGDTNAGGGAATRPGAGANHGSEVFRVGDGVAPVTLSKRAAEAWNDLDATTQARAASATARLLIAKEFARVPVQRREISVMLTEVLGLALGPNGRLPLAVTGIRSKAVELASRHLLYAWGLRVEEVKRVSLGGARSGASAGAPASAAFSQYEPSSTQGEAPDSGATPASVSTGAEGYILVSDLPPRLRPPPAEPAFAGLLAVLACILALEPTGIVGEHKLYATLARLGVRGLPLDAGSPTRGGDDARTERAVASAAPTAVDAGDATTQSTFGGVDVRHLLEVKLPRQFYLQRFRADAIGVGGAGAASGSTAAANAGYAFAAGPRLRVELPGERLYALLREIFGDDMDEAARRELRARLAPAQSHADHGRSAADGDRAHDSGHDGGDGGGADAASTGDANGDANGDDEQSQRC